MFGKTKVVNRLFSMIDYPNEPSHVYFVYGCNYRCFYCHNKNLAYPEYYNVTKKYAYTWKELRKMAEGTKNVGYPLAAVVTGGEPTTWDKLPKFIYLLKSCYERVKLDTNGTNPKMLKELIDNNLLDYVAMDIKHQLREDFYEAVVNTNPMLEKVRESIKIILDSGIDYEFRTTSPYPQVMKADWYSILNDISIINNGKKIKKYVIQKATGHLFAGEPNMEVIHSYVEKLVIR